MRCHCCSRQVPLGRKVKLRPFVDLVFFSDLPDPFSYHAYVENMTFRWSFVCFACYRIIDSFDGTGQIDGKIWNLAGRSRGDRAAVVDEARWRAFERREADKLGLG
jgi:hypothetical protein